MKKGRGWSYVQYVLTNDDKGDASHTYVFLRTSEDDSILTYIYFSAEEVRAHICNNDALVIITSSGLKALREMWEFDTLSRISIETSETSRGLRTSTVSLSKTMSLYPKKILFHDLRGITHRNSIPEQDGSCRSV